MNILTFSNPWIPCVIKPICNGFGRARKSPGQYGNIQITDKKFWNVKRIFITGNTRFTGGWLSLLLHNMGVEEVNGYTLAAPAESALFHIADIVEKMTSELGNIRDY